MILLLLVAFVSGLVTILAPCIWPLLPVVLSASYGGSRKKSLGITLGIVTSFGAITLTLSYIVSIFKFDPDILRFGSAMVIAFLGLVLFVPYISRILETQVSRFSGRFGMQKTSSAEQGFGSGLFVGLALGIVWTPCAGPILATVATLAGTRAVNLGIVLVTIVYLVGIAIPLFFFSIGSAKFFSKFTFVNKYTGRVQQVFGLILILMAVLIFTNLDKTISAVLLSRFPSYSNLLTKIETTGGVQSELNKLKGQKDQKDQTGHKSDLKVLGQAPDFVGITKWINVDKPLTSADLRGKVVLVDFWTYTCINCIRTLPYVTSWYDKYRDRGFVVIGVHTPEFEFEKKTENVERAIEQFKIHYPVAQDNDYKTWNSYQNQYWPAKYLIDAQGRLRNTYFGEGNYAETEKNIQALLAEAGQNADIQLTDNQSSTGTSLLAITPETYLGMSRTQNFASRPKPIVSGVYDFSSEDPLPLGYFAYRGKWNWQDEYGKCVSSCSLYLHFKAKKVHLVIKAPDGAKGQVFLDENGVGVNQAGDDVKNQTVTLNGERLYTLISLDSVSDHVLRVDFENPGVQVYAFTFGD